MKIFTLTLLLLGCLAAFGQKNEISVLNNRFYFVFPDSAKNIARGTDIMSAGPNENKETRIIYDEGNKRLVFFARELLLKTTANLASTLSHEATKENPFSVKSIFNGDSVVAVMLTPQKLDSAEKAILIKSLVIQNADGTLSKVNTYINPAAFADKKRFDQIAETVFSSFRKGWRRLPIAAHTDTFAIMGSKTTLQMKLPDGYITTKTKAEDFDVFQITRLSGYDEKDESSITVYFGFYPIMFSSEFELAGFKKADTQGQLMFHSLPWENYFDPARNLYLREQVFDDDEIEKGMKLHIAILSNNKNRIEEMSGIIKDLLIVYDPANVK